MIFGQTFSQFINRIHDAQTETNFHDAGSDLAQALGFRWFAYLSLDGEDRPELISSYERDWTGHYFGCRYEGLDPVVIGARERHEPFRWGALGPESIPLRPRQRALFDDAASFGITAGVTVPISDPRGGVSAFTLATDERGARLSGLQRDLARFEAHLQAAALYFQNRTELKLGCSRPAPSDVTHPLTPGQLACLSAIADGDTMKEAARRLQLAPSTVEFHLRAARHRLGARTLQQAVKVAAHRGWLT